MTCESEITVSFPDSNIEVRPYDADIRVRKDQFTHAQFELSEEAGELIAEEANVAAKAFIKFGDNRAYRMYLPAEGVSFRESIDEVTVARLDLKDARQILERGSIEKTFGDTSLGDVIEYIFENRNDPNDVLTDYQFVDESSASLERKTAFRLSRQPGVMQDAAVALADSIESFTGININPDNSYSGFDFKGDSPLMAIQKTLDEFETDWWVENDGILYIGPSGTRGQLVGVFSGGGNIELSRYTITSREDITSTVQIRGPYTTLIESKIRYRPDKEKVLQLIAEADATEIDGSAEIYTTSKQISSPEQLENAAVRALYQEIMSDTNGSMVINGLASEDTDSISKLSPGDYIFVGESIADECGKNVTTGLFMITSVSHVANAQRGWNITCHVSRIPNPETLVTNSVFYDPTADKNYEDLEAYKEDAPPLIENTGWGL